MKSLFDNPYFNSADLTPYDPSPSTQFIKQELADASDDDWDEIIDMVSEYWETQMPDFCYF